MYSGIHQLARALHNATPRAPPTLAIAPTMLHRTAAAAATPLRRAALARQATWRTAHGAVAAAHRSHHRYRSDSAAAADPPPAAAVPRILVLGGNGFVGNAVCEAALVSPRPSQPVPWPQRQCSAALGVPRAHRRHHVLLHPECRDGRLVHQSVRPAGVVQGGQPGCAAAATPSCSHPPDSPAVPSAPPSGRGMLAAYWRHAGVETRRAIDPC